MTPRPLSSHKEGGALSSQQGTVITQAELLSWTSTATAAADFEDALKLHGIELTDFDKNYTTKSLQKRVQNLRKKRKELEEVLRKAKSRSPQKQEAIQRATACIESFDASSVGRRRQQQQAAPASAAPAPPESPGKGAAADTGPTATQVGADDSLMSGDSGGAVHSWTAAKGRKFQSDGGEKKTNSSAGPGESANGYSADSFR